MQRKAIATVLSLALVACLGAAGALAWLTDSDQATNTFTVGNIDIRLDEKPVDPETGKTIGGDRVQENAYKMVPGRTLDKDPIVTVEKGSEACWLFVEAVKTDNFDSFMTYKMAEGWTALGGEGNEGVYYRVVQNDDEADQLFEVLYNSEVRVKHTVTKQMMDGLTEDTYPTLTFNAYAIQKEGFATVGAAWDAVAPK